MTLFYLVRRTEKTAFENYPEITREVITEELQTGDETLKTCEASSWRDAKRLLVAEMTEQQKELANALRFGL